MVNYNQTIGTNKTNQQDESKKLSVNQVHEIMLVQYIGHIWNE